MKVSLFPERLSEFNETLCYTQDETLPIEIHTPYDIAASTHGQKPV